MLLWLYPLGATLKITLRLCGNSKKNEKDFLFEFRRKYEYKKVPFYAPSLLIVKKFDLILMFLNFF